MPTQRPANAQAPGDAIGRRAPARALAGFACAFVTFVALPAMPAVADELEVRAAAWAAGDARILSQAAPRLVDSALTPTLTAMEGRVGSYADWVYGWFSSLLVAWDLAATGASEAFDEISAGSAPNSNILYERLAEVVQQRFDETVVQPERSDRAIAQGWRRAMIRVTALDNALAVERRARIERTAALLRIGPAPVLERFGGPLLTMPVAASVVPPDLRLQAFSAIEDRAGGTADHVLVRSLRPLATRALSVTTRLLLAPVAGGLVASPVVGTNGLAGAAATLVAVSAAIWGVDYAINRIDSTLTRPNFEIGLRRLVRDAHVRASRSARAHAGSTVCAAFADDRMADTACGELPTVAGTGHGG